MNIKENILNKKGTQYNYFLCGVIHKLGKYVEKLRLGRGIQLSTLYTRLIPKKANIKYINFGDKYDLQIQIVTIFRKKDF